MRSLLNRLLSKVAIIGTGNVLSSYALNDLNSNGVPVISIGQESSLERENPPDIVLDVTNFSHWKELLNDPRFSADCNFVYVVGYGAPSTMLLTSGDGIREHTEINLIGLQNFFFFLANRKVLNNQLSSVVIVSSLNATLPVPGYGGYCATKAGALMLAKTAAIELAPKYRINSVLPGPFHTKAESSALNRLEYREALRSKHLLEMRLTTPKDIWLVILFLLSSNSNWITGCSIPVDGGLHLFSAG